MIFIQQAFILPLVKLKFCNSSIKKEQRICCSFLTVYYIPYIASWIIGWPVCTMLKAAPGAVSYFAILWVIWKERDHFIVPWIHYCLLVSFYCKCLILYTNLLPSFSNLNVINFRKTMTHGKDEPMVPLNFLQADVRKKK